MVAECGSFAQAARRLNVTPAAVAQRIRALEAELGQTLVSRVGRTVRSTAAGMAVQRHGPNLVKAACDLRAIAADDLPAGQVRIGTTATALTGQIPEIIAKLSMRFPQIEYFLMPGSSVDLYHAVLAGDLDTALIMQPHFPVPKSLGWITLRHEPNLMSAIVPRHSPKQLLLYVCARILRPFFVPNFWTVTMSGAKARKTARADKTTAGGKTPGHDVSFDRELENLPPALRWREWMLRVEAVLFAAAEPVDRETLARVVGKDCSIDLLIDDLREELSSRPYELVAVADGWQHRSRWLTRPQFALRRYRRGRPRQVSPMAKRRR